MDGSTADAPRPATNSLTGAALDTVSRMNWFRTLTFGQVIIMAFVAGGFYLVYWTIDTGLPQHEKRVADGFEAINVQNIGALNAITKQNADALTAAANLNATAITSAATLHAEAIKGAAILNTEAVKSMTEHAEKAAARRERETAKNEQLMRELFGMRSGKPTKPPEAIE